MPISSCAHVRQQSQYVCLILIRCTQYCYQEHCNTYISHCWHMPPEKYASHITHVPLHYYCGLSIYFTLLDIQVQKKINCNFSLPCYCHVCTRNKYAHQMPHIPITPCADVRQLCLYICLIYTHCTEQQDQKCMDTCIPHYWNMPATFHICPTALLL